MAMDFGKLNFAVGFNRTSAFPLDANSYFETYDDAVAAAAGAAVVGSADSAYYIGQLLIVNDGATGVGLYQINAGKTLTKFGQASSADELAEKVSALESRCTNIEGKLILATTEKDGFLSKEDKAKLDGIAEGAQVNVLEGVQVDGVDLTIEDKKVNIDLSSYAKKTEVEAVKEVADAAVSTADFEAFKSTNTTAIADAKKAGTDAASALDAYEKTNDAAVAEAKKAGTDAAAALETYKTSNDAAVKKNADDISTINGKITGLTGAMHFKGVVEELPEDKSAYEAGDVVIVGNKEYVLAGEDTAKEWHELGDEGSHLTKEEAAQTYATKAALKDVTDDYLKAADKTELEGKIATAKSEAITEAVGQADTAADTKIATALEDYTTTADLTTELDRKVDKVTGKSLVDDTLITKMEGIKDNAVIKGVEGGIKLDAESGKISVDAANMPVIGQDKVEGLDTALAGKQDKNATLTAIAGLEGAGLVRKTAEGVELDAADYLVEADLADYAKSADVTAEINEAVKDKQTAAQVNALIANAAIKADKIDGKVAEAATADKVVNALTFGSKTYNGAATAEITAEDLGALTEIAKASDDAIGGILTGYTSDATHRAVELDENGKAFVEIPAAMVYSAKADGGLEVADGAFSIKAGGVVDSMIGNVSTDKLTQGANKLILNGGDALSE